MPVDAPASSLSVLDFQRRIDELSSKLRESESRHALVSDAVAEGIYEWSIEANSLWVSSRLIEMFGFEGRELKAADWNELIHPDDFAGYRNALRGCLKGATKRLDCEYRVRHSDGAYRWIEDRAVGVRNGAGRAVRLVGAVSDVTARKEAEQALREALEQQTATAEVLSVINSSPGNLFPVFDAMLAKAMRLCDAAIGGLGTWQENRFSFAALRGPQPLLDYVASHEVSLGSREGFSRVARAEGFVQYTDISKSELYESGEPYTRALVDLCEGRTTLSVPLVKDGVVLGVLAFFRQEVKPFSDKQIALLMNFASQAVIAMENARLLGELRARTGDLQESLEYQTAISEVIQVISRSTFDLVPVLQTLTESAIRLCEADMGFICRREGDVYRVATAAGSTPEFAQNATDYQQYQQNHPLVADRSSLTGRVVLEKGPVQIADVTADPEYLLAQASALGGIRSQVGVPLMREGSLIGVIILSRQRVQPFTNRQIELLRVFADQAVIAIENTRLLTEQREALEQQTATAEVLQVINASPGNLGPVFNAMLEKAMTLCGAAFGFLTSYDGQRFTPVAMRGVPPSLTKYFTEGMDQPRPGESHYRILQGEDVIHNLDQKEEEAYRSGLPLRRAVVDLGGARTALVVALRKDDAVLGALTIYRKEVRPFSDKEIALMKNFAEQAVIAIENARLLSEQRDALEQQTATAEVLQIINSSPGNLGPVFKASLERATRLCDATFAILWLCEGERFHAAALHGVPERYAEIARVPCLPGPNNPLGRMLRGERLITSLDAAADDLYRTGDPVRRALVDVGGARSFIQVALVKDDVLLGTLTVYRQEVRAFSEKQIALLQNFAAQSVIAIENARLINETREALERQTATAELLEVINSSPGNLQPVFDAMLERAVRLSESAFGMMNLFENNSFRRVALRGVPKSLVEQEPSLPAPGPNNALSRIVNGEDVVCIDDLAASPSYREGDMRSRGMVELAGARSLLAVAMRKDGDLIGTLTAYRQEVRPFSEKQIALLQSFAAQAVIAIDNARLLDELRDRQAELRVTFDSMGDGVAMFDGDHRLAAWNRNFEQIMALSEEWLVKRPTYEEYLALLAERGEFGAENVEAELASRLEDTERELRLERTRADGSVIEVRRNAVPGGGFVLIYGDITERRRAETEIRAARDAAEMALERQTATADILKVIASSPTDVQPVLDEVVKAAVRFCGATDANIHMRDGDEAISAAHYGPLKSAVGRRRPLDRQTGFGLAILEHRPVQLPDIDALDPVQFASARQLASELGFRAVLAAPFLRDGTAIGAITLRRIEPGPFTKQQIALLETFAAQAVIAIENVRLFNDLREALEQQTATADILRVISQSPTDVTPVLTAVASAALKFCGARDAQVALRDGDTWSVAAHEGPIGALRGTRRLNRQTAPGRAMVDGEVVQIGDLQSAEGDEFQEGRELGARLGFRSALAAPLLRDDVPIGAISLRRPEAGLFTPNQVELLKSFAAQAVIAIENVRLFTELRDSLERLKAAQANLIQAEKMASLGQLTAGIAHEIKNPLNFVNNFAGLSVELLDELKEIATPVLGGMKEDARAEFTETVELLTGNLRKIGEHGKRADGIVKSMLSHSRGGTGDWQESNINALVEEALNLAYHGARAQDKDFNVTLERDFAPETKSIEVVPQDVTRVFLNLFGNGFYATRKRHVGGGDGGYRPTLKVSTRDLGEAVEVTVRDNGTGIQPEVRAKLFQPFFTTKPTGEGTGLGLSISYDIVTQQHGGTIEVESEPGSFTKFTVRLPRSRRVAQSRGA